MPRRPLLLETFEDRILCDAVPLVPVEPPSHVHADAAMHATAAKAKKKVVAKAA